MNGVVRAFVEDVVEALDCPDPVVEFGALQVADQAGADLRDLFPGRPYTGTDFRAGPGVDRIEDLRSLTLPDGTVGTAICLETLEHCEDPIRACSELARVVADGGLAVISTPMLIGMHAHPNDYFRFTTEALRSMLEGFDSVWTGSYGDPAAPFWVFAVAARGRDLELGVGTLSRLAKLQQAYDAAGGRYRIGPLQLTPGELARTVGEQTPRVVRDRLSTALSGDGPPVSGPAAGRRGARRAVSLARSVRSAVRRDGSGGSAVRRDGSDGSPGGEGVGLPDGLAPEMARTLTGAEVEILRLCRPLTMTSPERVLALVDAVRYLVARGIDGALVECGVWRGGSALAMVLALQETGAPPRDLWLYDTFAGMTEPSPADVSVFEPPALEQWGWTAGRGERMRPEVFGPHVFGEAQVRAALTEHGYPSERLHTVPGDVHRTLPAQRPAAIALLRLDTDWYSSTRHELEHLYPRLVRGGVLVIDDYGHWDGARRAVDELLAAEPLLLQRIDYTGRIAVKV